MMKLHLKDAYYAFPIHPSHRKYLRFIYQDRTYAFQCLPFGLSSAPRVFTKALKPVLVVLQSMGIWVVIYIDYMLLHHQQSKVLRQIFAQVEVLMEKLGLLVKKEKCSPIPGERLIFLGAALDSTTMALSLPQPKLATIVDTYHHLIAQGSGSVRTLSTFIGQMSHASQTGILVAPLHYRDPQRLHLQAVSHHGQARKVIVPLTFQVHKDLAWWVSESSYPLNGCPIQLPPIDLTVWGDASKQSLGAAYQGISTGGHWRVDEAKCHINVLELRAATLALKAFLQSQEPQHSPLKHIHLRTDITIAVVYINKRGGIRSPALTAQGLELWAVALTPGVSLTAQHISSIQNVELTQLPGISRPEPNGHWTKRSSSPFVRDSTHQKWTSLHPV